MVFQVRRGSWTIARARVMRRSAAGEQADQVVALDEIALFVEEEAAVEVAVPGQAEVGAMLAHGVGR